MTWMGAFAFIGAVVGILGAAYVRACTVLFQIVDEREL